MVKKEPKLLSIIILSSNRFDLLQNTILSLLNTVTYPHFEFIIYNHNAGQTEGWIKLIKMVQGEYVLNCEDDWFFIDRGDWVQQSIKILDENPKVGIVRLRKDKDGQTGNKLIKKVDCGSIVDTSGFTLNPFIARTENLVEMIKDNPEISKSFLEYSLKSSFTKFRYQVAKLDEYDRKGIAIHIGWGRKVRNNK